MKELNAEKFWEKTATMSREKVGFDQFNTILHGKQLIELFMVSRKSSINNPGRWKHWTVEVAYFIAKFVSIKYLC